MSFPKHIPWESEEYRKWSRETQPCKLRVQGCGTWGNKMVFHHSKTRGSGGSDSFGLTCCPWCHSLENSVPKREQYRIAILQKEEWLMEVGNARML